MRIPKIKFTKLHKTLKSLESTDTNQEIIDEWKEVYPNLKHVRVNEDTKGYLYHIGESFVAILQFDTKTKYIIALEISPEYRELGLSHHLLNRAYREGINKLSVNKNNVKAFDIYKKYGYRIIDSDDTMYYMKRGK